MNVDKRNISAKTEEYTEENKLDEIPMLDSYERKKINILLTISIEKATREKMKEILEKLT